MLKDRPGLTVLLNESRRRVFQVLDMWEGGADHLTQLFRKLLEIELPCSKYSTCNS